MGHASSLSFVTSFFWLRELARLECWGLADFAPFFAVRERASSSSFFTCLLLLAARTGAPWVFIYRLYTYFYTTLCTHTHTNTHTHTHKSINLSIYLSINSSAMPLEYVSIRQYMSAYVSIRQYMSALPHPVLGPHECRLHADTYWRMPTYADIYWRMLTYANRCASSRQSRMSPIYSPTLNHFYVLSKRKPTRAISV
jgi:hypothetical protein